MYHVPIFYDYIWCSNFTVVIKSLNICFLVLMRQMQINKSPMSRNALLYSTAKMYKKNVISLFCIKFDICLQVCILGNWNLCQMFIWYIHEKIFTKHLTLSPPFPDYPNYSEYLGILHYLIFVCCQFSVLENIRDPKSFLRKSCIKFNNIFLATVITLPPSRIYTVIWLYNWVPFVDSYFIAHSCALRFFL